MNLYKAHIKNYQPLDGNRLAKTFITAETQYEALNKLKTLLPDFGAFLSNRNAIGIKLVASSKLHPDTDVKLIL